MSTNDNKPEQSSTSKIQPSESHPSYKLRFRHVNCPKSNKLIGFSPSCTSTVNWQPSAANAKQSPNPSDATALEAPETGCCGIDDGVVSKNDVLMLKNIDLVDELEKIARKLCDEKAAHIQGIVILREFIMWGNGPPTSSSGSKQIIHDSAVTPVHLALMRQRKCEDFIEVEWATHYDDEEFRRENMLKALTKLAKRASSHCNR
ncbi:hypothetical protein F4803DRAFT_546015 [Xylaria telfairii]|nr:hypothetical protein F4803DRAFT_546015 [Xylaria telfairii]